MNAKSADIISKLFLGFNNKIWRDIKLLHVEMLHQTFRLNDPNDAAFNNKLCKDIKIVLGKNLAFKFL